MNEETNSTQKMKNVVLILSVLILSTFAIGYYFDLGPESLVISIPATILVVFVFNKLAKKFNF